MKGHARILTLCLLGAIAIIPRVAHGQAAKPNILVIMGDDIGWFNPSAYHRGIMGYTTSTRGTTEPR